MSTSFNILLNTSQRLGINSTPVLSKAEEYLRLFQTKGSSIKTLSDITKTVLCLDLATQVLGEAFDKETALKLSGLKKSAYQNSLNTVKKILDVDRPLTISELCVQLSCTSVKDTAEDIFQKYISADNKLRDYDHPQYKSAAIYTACKVKKLKADKSQFVTLSRLKPMQWKELANEFCDFAEKNGIATLKKTKKEKDWKDAIDEITTECAAIDIKKPKKEETEDYETWKMRILKEAYKALGKECPVLMDS